MSKWTRWSQRLGALALLVVVGPVRAHITPTITLLNLKDAAVRMLPQGSRYFIKEVSISPAERRQLEETYGWKPEEDSYRFILARDQGGRLLAFMAVISRDTRHGPVKLAVGFDPRGRITDAAVMQIQEEPLTWVRPLLKGEFLQHFTGRSAAAKFGPAEGLEEGQYGSLSKTYARILVEMLWEAAILAQNLVQVG